MIGFGKSIEGIAGILGTLAVLAGVVVYSKERQRKDAEEKRRALQATMRQGRGDTP